MDLREDSLFWLSSFTMKVSSIDRQMGVLAHPDDWILDDQAGMSKKGD